MQEWFIIILSFYANTQKNGEAEGRLESRQTAASKGKIKQLLPDGLSGRDALL